MSEQTRKLEREGYFPKKGNSLLCFPKDYVVLDLETTGLSPLEDRIIEIGAIKVQDNQEVGRFSSFLRPEKYQYLRFNSQEKDFVFINGKKATYLSPFISSLTHITNQDLKDAKGEKEVLSSFLDFLGDSVIVGHNVNFDIDFLYQARMRKFSLPLSNDFVDTLRISKSVRKRMQHRTLEDLCELYGIDDSKAHRALEDALMTKQVLSSMKEDFLDQHFQEEEIGLKKSTCIHPLNKRNLDAPRNNPFYDKTVVFTGFEDKQKMQEEMNMVYSLGGKIENDLFSFTHYLVFGGKNTPLYQEAKRKPICILSEEEFLRLFDETK